MSYRNHIIIHIGFLMFRHRGRVCLHLGLSLQGVNLKLIIKGQLSSKFVHEYLYKNYLKPE